MPSKLHPELFLTNILVSIDKIIRNTKELTFLQFIEDEVRFGFIIRELQEIGESVRKLLDMQYLHNNDYMLVHFQYLQRNKSRLHQCH